MKLVGLYSLMIPIATYFLSGCTNNCTSTIGSIHDSLGNPSGTGGDAGTGGTGGRSAGGADTVGSASAGGDPSGNGDPQKNCANCDDGNPCTDDICCDGYCTHHGYEHPLACKTMGVDGTCAWDKCIVSDCAAMPDGVFCMDAYPYVGVCKGEACVGPACTLWSDCPTTQEQCKRPACTGGICAIENMEDGSLCSDPNNPSQMGTCAGGICG